jgi:hypothetical protein
MIQDCHANNLPLFLSEEQRLSQFFYTACSELLSSGHISILQMCGFGTSYRMVIVKMCLWLFT